MDRPPRKRGPLVSELARAFAGRADGNVALAELSAVDTPDRVPDSVAAALVLVFVLK